MIGFPGDLAPRRPEVPVKARPTKGEDSEDADDVFVCTADDGMQAMMRLARNQSRAVVTAFSGDGREQVEAYALQDSNPLPSFLWRRIDEKAFDAFVGDASWADVMSVVSVRLADGSKWKWNLETDLVDPRYCSPANIKNRMESYFQMIEQKRQGARGAAAVH